MPSRAASSGTRGSARPRRATPCDGTAGRPRTPSCSPRRARRAGPHAAPGRVLDPPNHRPVSDVRIHDVERLVSSVQDPRDRRRYRPESARARCAARQPGRRPPRSSCSGNRSSSSSDQRTRRASGSWLRRRAGAARRPGPSRAGRGRGSARPGSDPRCRPRRPSRRARRRRRPCGDRYARAVGGSSAPLPGAEQPARRPSAASRVQRQPRLPPPEVARRSPDWLVGVRALAVDDEPHGHAFARLRDQRLGEPLTDAPGRNPNWLMWTDDVAAAMSAQHRRIELLSFDEDLDRRSRALLERDCEVGPAAPASLRVARRARADHSADVRRTRHASVSLSDPVHGRGR